MAMTLAGVDPIQHLFHAEDCFAWLERAKKGKQRYDLVIVDPPSYSSTSVHGSWRRKLSEAYPEFDARLGKRRDFWRVPITAGFEKRSFAIR